VKMTPRIVYFSPERSEFISNELGWIQIDQFEAFLDLARGLLSSNNFDLILVYLCGNERSECGYLEKLPKNSVWVYLYADETYSPRLNSLVLGTDSVLGVIRPYWHKKVGFRKKWFQFFVTTLAENSNLKLIPFFKLGAAGLVMLLRQYCVKMITNRHGKRVIKAPLGYTNNFARVYRDLSDINTFPNSLISHALKKEPEGRTRKIFLSFVGQTGNTQRSKFIDSAELKKATSSMYSHLQFRIIKRIGFGGTIGSNDVTFETIKEFLEIGKDSKFGLCPPGNYAGQTFRFLELLILGALPIECPFVISDPSYEPQSTFGLESDYSMQIDLGNLLRIDEQNRSDIVTTLLLALQQDCKSLTEEIWLLSRTGIDRRGSNS